MKDWLLTALKLYTSQYSFPLSPQTLLQVLCVVLGKGLFVCLFVLFFLAPRIGQDEAPHVFTVNFLMTLNISSVEG